LFRLFYKQKYIEKQFSNSPFGHIDSPIRPTLFFKQTRGSKNLNIEIQVTEKQSNKIKN